jgi:4'-phosphopantetheinyl transferase
VHVWSIREPEARDEATHRRCRQFLSPDELTRWGRMPPSQQMLYASAHAGLRTITAAYTGVWPSQVEFRTGEHGKPYVAGFPGLRVNLAHTRGMSLVAVSSDGPVGVDVERVRALTDAQLRPEVLLSTWERARWSQAPAGRRRTDLITYWACKEAVLKASGTGLTGDLTAVQIAPGDRVEGPVPIHALPDSPACSRRWTLRLVNLGPGYRSAVAVVGGGEQLRCFRLAAGTLPAGALPAGAQPAAAAPTTERKAS